MPFSSSSCTPAYAGIPFISGLMLMLLVPTSAWAIDATTTALAVTSAGKHVTSVAAGSVVTLIATVTVAGRPVTTGQIEFCDATPPSCTDIHLLGMSQLTTTGSASLRFRPGIGIFAYKAMFLPSAGHPGSSSSGATLTVQGSVFANTTTTLSSSGSQGNYQLQALVTAAGVRTVPPAGSVFFQDSGRIPGGVAAAVLGPSLPGLGFHNAYTSGPGDVPEGIVVADFNGDGVPDLAVTDNYESRVTIRLGNGDGTFTTLSASPATDFGPTAVVAADFNGDGNMDLAVASPGDEDLTVLLGKGDGTFVVASYPTTDGTPAGLAAGDFNEDGIEDLVMANDEGRLTVLLGKGDGTFAAAAAGPYEFSSPAAITMGDFNHDGHLDLAVADDGAYYHVDPSVHIMLGNGDGTFQTGADPTVYTFPSSIVAGDFNGDGNLDIATAGTLFDQPGTMLCILTGDGKGDFTQQPDCSSVSGDMLAMADFNADGIPDLAVDGTVTGVEVLLGKGDGTFPSPIFWETGILNELIAAADYNGDGLPDLAVVNLSAESVSILTTQFTETATATALSVTPVGTGVHAIYAAYPGTSTTGRSASRILGLQGVAATTTALVVSSHAKPATTVISGSVVTLTATVTGVSPSDGQVNFCDAMANDCLGIHLLGTAQVTGAGTAAMSYIPGIGIHSYKAVFVVDANGAGSESIAQPLIVTGNYPTITSLAVTDDHGTYTLSATVIGKPDVDVPVSGSVSFLDATNDDHLLGTVVLTQAASDLTFLQGANTATGKSPVDVVTADFNGDGLVDAAVLNSGEDSLTVLLGKGNGAFRAVQVPYTADSPHGIAVGDWNGDGRPDIAVTNDGNRILTMLFGKGDGTFVSTATVLPGAGPYQIAAADFNGDGRADLTVTDHGNNVAYILLGRGDGTFSAATSVATGVGPYGVTVADFNGDNRADLAIVNDKDQTVTIFLGKGDGTFSTSSTLLAGKQPYFVVSGDFNGDGKADLAVSNFGGDDLSILLGHGDGTFAPAPSPATGRSPYGLAITDLNRDGKTDLIVVNGGDETLTVLLGNGDGTFTASSTPPEPGESLSRIALADFNGDGVPDMVMPSFAKDSAPVLLTTFQQRAEAILTNVSRFADGKHEVEASYPANAPYQGSHSMEVPVP